MDYFTKKGIVFWVFVLLTLLNISTLATIGFHHFSRPPHPLVHGHHPMPPHEMPPRIQRFYKKRLGLTDEQTQQFKNLRATHFQSIKKAHDEVHQAKKDLFDVIWETPTEEARIQELMQQITAQHQHIARQDILHVSALKAVCDEQQQQELKRLIRQSPLFKPPHMPPPPH